MVLAYPGCPGKKATNWVSAWHLLCSTNCVAIRIHITFYGFSLIFHSKVIY